MGSETSLTGSGAIRVGYRGASVEPETEAGAASLQKAALYVFGDKAQVKGLKVAPRLKVDFVPVEYPEPRRIRASFKKLMQVHDALLSNLASPSLNLKSKSSLAQCQIYEGMENVDSGMSPKWQLVGNL